MPTKLCRKLKFERLSSHTLCALNGNRSHFSVLLNLLRCELIVKRYDAPTPSYFLTLSFINIHKYKWYGLEKIYDASDDFHPRTRYAFHL